MFSCIPLLILISLFSAPGSQAILRIRLSRSGTFCAQENYALKGHVIAEDNTTDGLGCAFKCVSEPSCRSVNIRKGSNGAACQLRNATQFSAKKEDFEKSMHHNHVFDSDDIPVSCSQIKVSVPSSKSGYYLVRAFSSKCKTRLVYCDMQNHGGGWTLVTSVSNTNNNHLQRNKVNCLNNTLCVVYTTTNIQTRKMSDSDIRAMAEKEGVFRVVVQKSTPYSVFFKIPSGSQYFDSSCDANSCPRLITSHTYPFSWQSSCKGTTIGYAIGYSGSSVGMHCYHVFDNESPHDCSSPWKSSKYFTERALYGFTCWGNKGIYNNLNGFLFAK